MITRKSEQSVSVREAMRGGSRQVELTTLLSALPERARLFSTLRLIPGASIGVHRHDGEAELFYIISGSAHFIDDGAEFDLCAGDATATLSGHSHGIENRGETDLVLLAAIIKD